MNTVGIDMVDDMRWILMIVLRGRVMGQSLPRWPFSKALNVGELYIDVLYAHLYIGLITCMSMCVAV
jgi:hypothetical protein